MGTAPATFLLLSFLRALLDQLNFSVLPEKIAVGISISLSGKFRLQGEQALRGVQLWVAYVNQEGGIYIEERAQSLAVELIAYDDRSKMDRAKDNVVRLLKEDRVDILLGPYSSVLTMAVAPIAESEKKILWNHGGASDAICRQGWRYLVSVLSPASCYLRSLPAYLTMRETSLRRLLCLTASSGTFAAHFIAASVIFLMLGAFTTGLHFYVEWLKSLKVEPIFIYTFKGLEYLVFGTDVVLFVVYVGGSAIKAILTMVKRWIS